MKKYENPNRRKQISFLLDPLGLSSKITIRKKTIAFLYLLSLGLVFTGGFLSNPPQQNTVLIIAGTAMSMIGGVMYMISWIGALFNSVKAGRWGWTISLFFLCLFVLFVYIFVGPDATPKPNESEISA